MGTPFNKLVAAIVGGPGTAVTTPTGFNGTLSIPMTRNGPTISTTFDITTLIPAITTTFYVDPVSGSDGNVGTSRGLPLLNLGTALAKANVDQIRIINLAADFVARGTKSWNNVQPTRSLSVIVEGSFRYISLQTTSAVIPTWTVNGTFSNVYQATFTATNSSNVTDLSSKTTSPKANCPVMFNTYTKVASLAAVAATAGTWFNDGTNTYVRAFDDRNITGDGNLVVSGSSNNGRFPAVNNCTIYVQGIDFVGGRPWYSFLASTVTGTVFAHNNCSFQGGASSGAGFNGLNIAAFQKVYGYRSGAYFSYADGFNYHSNESDGTTTGTSPTWFENECCGYGNGTTGAAPASNNASTSHDYCTGIRLNGYYYSNDRCLAETNHAQTWNLGGIVLQAKQQAAAEESISALISSQVWIDTVTAIAGGNPCWIAASAATLNYFNSGTVVNAGTAESTGTVAAYTA